MRKRTEDLTVTDRDVPTFRKKIGALEAKGWRMSCLRLSTGISVVMKKAEEEAIIHEVDTPELTKEFARITAQGWGGGSIQAGSSDQNFRFATYWTR